MLDKSKDNKSILSVLNSENLKLQDQISRMKQQHESKVNEIKAQNVNLEVDVECLEDQLLMLNEESKKLDILLNQQSSYNTNLKKRNDNMELRVDSVLELIQVEKAKRIHLQELNHQEELRAIDVISKVVEDQNLDKKLNVLIGNSKLSQSVNFFIM